jgi:MinD-like ATPase involved in chromosome partitioning or flagellar assembly
MVEMSDEYLHALAVARPDVIQQLLILLHLGTDRPVRIVTGSPLFDEEVLKRTLEEVRPQVLIVDSGVDGFRLAEVLGLRGSASSPLCIIGLGEPGSGMMDSLMEAGLDAVYALPAGEQTVERLCHEAPRLFEKVTAQWGKGAWGSGAPERIRGVMAASSGTSWQRQVIAVWSPKGGVGKTTIACELCSMLAGIGGRRVALIDANMNGGHVRARLNLDAPCGILNAASAYQRANGRASGDNELTKRIVSMMAGVASAPNWRVLAGVTNMEQSRHEHIAGEAGLEFAKFLLPMLARSFDVVIVDQGSSINVGLHQGLMHAVDFILVVCEPDMTSVADVREGVHRTVMPRVGVPLERFGLVINKWQDGLGVSLAEGAKFAGVSALGVVPFDTTGNVTRAGNEGISYVAKFADHRKNHAETEATIRGIAALAAHFYPPIAVAWAERLRENKDGRGLGIFRRSRR